MIQNYVHNKRCKRKVKSVVTDQGAPKRGSIEAQLEKITSPKQRWRFLYSLNCQTYNYCIYVLMIEVDRLHQRRTRERRTNCLRALKVI